MTVFSQTMHAIIVTFFFFLSCNTALIAEQAVPSFAPDEASASPPPELSIMPTQLPAPPAPTADQSTMMPSPAPSPDQTAIPTPPPTPTPPLSSDGIPAFADPNVSASPMQSSSAIKSERLQGPDTIELAENKPNIIKNSASQISTLFKQTDAPIAALTKTIGDIIKLREDLYRQYFELDATIDEALHSSEIEKGAVQAILTNATAQKPT